MNSITANEFVKREIAIYGEDEIFDLIEKGYVPVFTNRGWKWIESQGSKKTDLDTGTNLCYSGLVGSHGTPVPSGILTIAG